MLLSCHVLLFVHIGMFVCSFRNDLVVLILICHSGLDSGRTRLHGLVLFMNICYFYISCCVGSALNNQFSKALF